MRSGIARILTEDSVLQDLQPGNAHFIPRKSAFIRGYNCSATRLKFLDIPIFLD
jgi:hypothetical protein